MTIRNHLLAVAKRSEAELGTEQVSFIEGCPRYWAKMPIPNGPLTVGIDGGFVRAQRGEGWFEVIAGKSVLAFRRGDARESKSSKCFGFVQTYDDSPKRRLFELLKSQGLQENQQVVFLSDGGEDVRNLQVYLTPQAEHLLDWFHITMRLTVLRQQALGVNANQILETIERIKHYLWHGNVFQALQHIEFLQMDVDCIEDRTAKLEKLEQGIAEFLAYIQNNRAHIPNYGERYRHDETISTGFVESTVNQVVSKRFVKKQQMQWTPRGAHLLLHTRTKVGVPLSMEPAITKKAANDTPAPDQPDLLGLRDRALIAIMVYSFARVGAVISDEGWGLFRSGASSLGALARKRRQGARRSLSSSSRSMSARLYRSGRHHRRHRRLSLPQRPPQDRPAYNQSPLPAGRPPHHPPAGESGRHRDAHRQSYFPCHRDHGVSEE